MFRKDTIRIQSSLKELFGVLVTHNYYEGNICRDLEFTPTPETQTLMKNYGVLLKKFHYGFILLHNPRFSPDLLKQATSKTRFTFFVKSNNNRFVNFTNIPFLKEGDIYHFSNLKQYSEEFDVDNVPEIYFNFKNLSLGDKEKKILHLGDIEKIKSFPSKFFVTAKTFGEDDTDQLFSYSELEILDEKGEKEFKAGMPYKKDVLITQHREINFHVRKALEKFPDLNSQEKGKKAEELRKQFAAELADRKSRELFVDMSHAPSGRYTLKCGDKSVDFYLADIPGRFIIGMLDIYLDNENDDTLVDRNASNIEEVVRPQLMFFHFKSRPTYWRYFFMNYPDSNTIPLNILDERDGVEFSDPEKGMVANTGDSAVVIKSESPIHLMEKPNYLFYLQRRSGNRILKDVRLPSPRPDIVKPTKENDTFKIYSDIFVYL